MFWPFPRERKPGFRFYLGEAPRYDTPDQVESWLIRLRFEEPWTKTEIAPSLTVERSLAHEEGRKQSGGFDPLPAQPAERLAQARVRFEDAAGGREAYVVALSLFLDEKQIAQCQATSLGDVEKSAADLFNSKRYAESLEAYREVARRKPDSAWAHRGVADCLEHLGKQREAIPSYRKATELAPKDLDHLYWYANSLINVQSKEAVTQFRKLVGLEPDKARGFIGLGNSLSDVDRFAESVQAFEKAEKLCPTCLDEADRKAYKEARELAK
jgi:tetratricopeptide (TPR) repeat protein